MLFANELKQAGVAPWLFHDPQRIAGCIPPQLIHETSAEEPFHPVRTLTTEHDSSSPLVQQAVENSVDAKNMVGIFRMALKPE